MTREGDYIDVLLFHVDGDLPRGLRSIDGEGDPPLFAVRPDLFDGLDGADHIRGVVHDDELGIVLEPLANIVRVNETLVIEGYPIHLDVVEFTLMVKGPQYRVVLDCRRDSMV